MQISLLASANDVMLSLQLQTCRIKPTSTICQHPVP